MTDPTAPLTFTFALPAGPRTFQLITEPTAAMYDFVRRNAGALTQSEDEPQSAYGERIYAWIFSDPVRLQEVMRMTLYGDHSGVDWYYHGDPVKMATVFVEFFLQVLPKVATAASNPSALDDLRARAAAHSASAHSASAHRASVHGAPAHGAGLAALPDLAR